MEVRIVKYTIHHWLFFNCFIIFIIETNDNEFDLLEEQEAFPPPPSVFNNLDHATSDSQQVEVEDFLEFDDSRIASLKEMGFSAEDAMNALRICDGDVNEALNYLLTSKD